MLMQLKNKQRKIASVTLSLFVGSWLLLLCQTCLATIDDSNSRSDISVESPSPCHLSTTDHMTSEKENLNSDHCLGSCDSDVLTVTISKVNNFELKEKIKSSLDLYADVGSQITLSNRARSDYRILTTPERPLLLPLQLYTVLLI
jgi:hypothetical protein